jgi:heme-degrading monooxygenase HmoA
MKSVCFGVVAFVALSGCEVARPFEGPGFKDGKVTSKHEGKFVASSTLVNIKDDSKSKEVFDKHMAVLSEKLEDQPGLVGVSLSFVVGSTDDYRTLAVWETEEDMLAWVTSEEHAAAMAEMVDYTEDGAVVSWEIEKDEIPPTWDEAKRRVDDDGRHAY